MNVEPEDLKLPAKAFQTKFGTLVTRRNRISGNLVSLYRGKDLGFTSEESGGGGRTVLICEAHGSSVNDTYDALKIAMSQVNWCDECRESQVIVEKLGPRPGY